MLRDLNTDFTRENCLFGAVELTKNADCDNYAYSSYNLGFDSRSHYSLPDRSFGKNVVIFGVDNSSSVYVNNKIEKILVLGEGPTQGLDNITITAETKYPINFTESGKRFPLSLHDNGGNCLLFVNDTKLCQLKAKDSEVKPYILCLGNISKDFTIDNMKKHG